MLAQNFKTAADLGIKDIELDALIKVLGMLERGELRHEYRVNEFRSLNANHKTVPAAFNMVKFYGVADCGTVCCICGWAEFVGSLPPASLVKRRLTNHELDRLFDPTGSVADPYAITPAQAAIALRSYLTTGDANWAEALA